MKAFTINLEKHCYESKDGRRWSSQELADIVDKELVGRARLAAQYGHPDVIESEEAG